MKAPVYPLRPFLPVDTPELAELFAQAIDELCAEDYSEEQRLAWISRVEDAKAFGERLGAMTTLVVKVKDDYAGFGSLKDNTIIDMLYVSPHYAGEGVGTALADALEKLAAGRGSGEVTVESSDTAVMFFEARGYVATARNSVPVEDQWLATTTLVKKFAVAASKSEIKP